MNKAEDFLLDVLSIMPACELPDEDSIIQAASLREQLMSECSLDDYECDQTSTHYQ